MISKCLSPENKLCVDSQEVHSLPYVSLPILNRSTVPSQALHLTLCTSHVHAINKTYTLAFDHSQSSQVASSTSYDCYYAKPMHLFTQSAVDRFFESSFLLFDSYLTFTLLAEFL